MDMGIHVITIVMVIQQKCVAHTLRTPYITLHVHARQILVKTEAFAAVLTIPHIHARVWQALREQIVK